MEPCTDPNSAAKMTVPIKIPNSCDHKTSIEAAYRRTDLFERRWTLMEQ